MVKHEGVKDPELRSRLGEAHGLLMKRNPTEAVKVLADVFLGMLSEHPELKTKTVPMRGREFPLVMRWPALGANLDLQSVREGEPRIDFVRQRFALSEALTYYEFTVDTAIEEGL